MMVSGLRADQLRYANGDVISGKLLGKTDSTIHFESVHFGVLKVSVADVELILESDKMNSAAEASDQGQLKEEVTINKEVVRPVPNGKNEISELIEPSADKEKKGGLDLLWASTEKTLNRFVHDRVPEWFPKLPEHWKGDLNLGININEAVSTSTRYYGSFNLEGDLKKTNYNMKTHFAYAEQDKMESENDWGLSGRFRYKLENTDFIEGLMTHDVDNLFDPAERSTASLGFGLKPVNNKKVTFDYVMGGALETLKLRTGDRAERLKINVNENFQWKFNQHMSLKQSIRLYVDPSEDLNYNFRFEAGLKTLIIGAFNLGLSYRMDFDSSIEDNDKRQKSRIITSLGVKF